MSAVVSPPAAPGAAASDALVAFMNNTGSTGTGTPDSAAWSA